jgi:AraC family transcriptional regulator, regulatory protein of adaptative response / methylated-DNA-[protein]-cysteine methyltransferase
MTHPPATSGALAPSERGSGTERRARAARVAADPRWSQLLARDASADGCFFYSVETTGVYCKPSCAARAPRPEHVAFHEDGPAAERAGFRPCKRCRPAGPSLEQERRTIVAELCRRIDAAESPPSLRELADHAGLSPHHLHRIFKAVTGTTPRAYAAARRDERVRAALIDGASVTQAIYAAGFGSSGRFYAASGRALGMKASEYRSGGKNHRIRFAVGQCSLGAILVAASESGVCAILLADDPEELVRDLERRFPRAELVGGDAEFERRVASVVGWVEAPAGPPSLPLDMRGTLFQERVWRALAEIPSGQTTTYAELAQRIGAPLAVRAVARACAQNPIAVAIPCHRVVRKDGELAGYRWGIERKRLLLEREAAPERARAEEATGGGLPPARPRP